ncbi:MAG: CCA tRNA nucleotidyltransferase [Chloroflexi bacterium]|nr:CCA tRNA nucleotidyltransferase [Chloroflexota bacterium]
MTDEPRPPEILDRLWQGLDAPGRAALTALTEAAEAREVALFAVGGVVRDLLHSPGGAPRINDLDLAVEGDPAPLLDALARATAVRPTRHDRFGTATLRLGGVRIDLARTRLERYPRSGALPVVRPATMVEDLARRDFSVNAMALALCGPRRAALLDPFGGRRDLERGLIRVLHDRSFRDDPTRVIRACRYAARLEARFAPGTGARARAALPRVRALSGARFGEAWRRLLLDPAAPAALAGAVALGVPAARLPGWSPPPRLVAAFGEIAGAETPAAGFWALTGLTAPPPVVAALPRACALTREERRALQGGARLRARRARLSRAELADSAAAALLRGQEAAVLRAAAALWRGQAGERARQAIEEWPGAASPLDAAALRALGVSPGPEIGRWLSLQRDAVIDGALPPGPAGVASARRMVREALDRDGGRGRGRRLQSRRSAAGERPPRRSDREGRRA